MESRTTPPRLLTTAVMTAESSAPLFGSGKCYATPVLVTGLQVASPASTEFGLAMAICPEMKLLAMSTYACTVHVFRIHDLHSGTPPLNVMVTRELRIGRASGDVSACVDGEYASPCVFDFIGRQGNHGCSGRLAFTATDTCFGAPLLLVTDHGFDVVHVLDPETGAHMGHVAPPRFVLGPRGVATRGRLVAMTSWTTFLPCDSRVTLFERSGVLLWTTLWSVSLPTMQGIDGIRISADGQRIVVAAAEEDKVSALNTETGTFAGHLFTGLQCVIDIEECREGWFACYRRRHLVAVDLFVKNDGAARRLESRVMQRRDYWDFCTLAMVMVEGLGLFTYSQSLVLYTTQDLVAMATMAESRLTWIAVVVRAVLRQKPVAI